MAKLTAYSSRVCILARTPEVGGGQVHHNETLLMQDNRAAATPIESKTELPPPVVGW
jgi:hypothetical protein